MTAVKSAIVQDPGLIFESVAGAYPMEHLSDVPLCGRFLALVTNIRPGACSIKYDRMVMFYSTSPGLKRLAKDKYFSLCASLQS